MNDRKPAQFTVYAAEAAIPRYQRAGVWGLAALAILVCGIVAGWLFGRAGSPSWERAPSAAHAPLVDGAALLARREAANARLRERIAGLEQALAGDACAPAALEALIQK